MKLEYLLSAELGQSIDQFCKDAIRFLLLIDKSSAVACFNDTYFTILKIDRIETACERWNKQYQSNRIGSI